MKSLIRFWENLSQRERLLIAVMGALIGGLLVFTALIQPLQHWQQNSRNLLAVAQRDAALIQDAVLRAQALRALASDRPEIRQIPIRQAVGETANRHGLAISRIQPASEGITIWVDGISAPLLFVWLEDLYRHYNIRTARLSIQRDDASGRLRVQVLLAGGAP